jgi:putative flavoprotein involved in K+ transport
VADTPQNQARTAGTTDVIVIGAGHAGLATSYCLSERSIEHVVLERGEVANSWRNERWGSLKLLTPNWQSRLPGFRYAGDDPDGFMDMAEVVHFIEDYATFAAAPVTTNTDVTSVRLNGTGYKVSTDAGEWRARSVVIASGACNVPVKPKAAEAIPDSINTLTPFDYHSPEQIEPGGVLVVGASATGLQLADEILAAGHEVTIATGEHVRMPRTYRGRDIQYWLDAAGILDERYDEIDDIARARRLPSPQLVGSHDPKVLDLNSMTSKGANLVGRFMSVRDGVAQFSGSLRNVCALADLKMNRMLDTIDDWAASSPDASEYDPAERYEPTRVGTSPSLQMRLDDGRIRTIVWATGYRPEYGWLDVPVLDRKGGIRHDGGVTESPGMYVVGLPVLRRRKSSFIHGCEDDVRDLVPHLAGFLDEQATPRPVTD